MISVKGVNWDGSDKSKPSNFFPRIPCTTYFYYYVKNSSVDTQILLPTLQKNILNPRVEHESVGGAGGRSISKMSSSLGCPYVSAIF